jgi:hypothetical protein
MGEWRISDNDELHNFYCSRNIGRVTTGIIGLAGRVARMGELRSVGASEIAVSR